MDEARRVASNIAKLPTLLRPKPKQFRQLGDAGDPPRLKAD